MSEQQGPPVQMFRVGDPVSRHNDTSLNFIQEAIYVPQLRMWRYGINYTQPNQCSLTEWNGGGFGFWEDESELKHPAGEKKLWGELWRELRRQRDLDAQMKASRERASALRLALETMHPEIARKEGAR